MKFSLYTASALAALFFVTAAHAQSSAQSSTAEQANSASQKSTMTAGQSSSGSLSSMDKKFLRHTAQGADYELTLGKLAEQRAAKPNVKQYAETIVSDHETLNSSLHEIAQKNGVSLPSKPDQQQEKKIDHIGRLHGAAFDKAFLGQMKQVNMQDKSKLQKEVSTTKNSQVKAFTQEMQTADAKHLQIAKQLQGQG